MLFPYYNQPDNQQLDFLDMITVYSAVLQTLDYAETMNQSSNDDIIKEMKLSIEYKLDKIIEQNKKIFDYISDQSKSASEKC